MKRESGYYWVKRNEQLGWEVAEWDSHIECWSRFNVDDLFYDFEFIEINETRIELF
jgi:hypothetical protein